MHVGVQVGTHVKMHVVMHVGKVCWHACWSTSISTMRAPLTKTNNKHPQSTALGAVFVPFIPQVEGRTD